MTRASTSVLLSPLSPQASAFNAQPTSSPRPCDPQPMAAPAGLALPPLTSTSSPSPSRVPAINVQAFNRSAFAHVDVGLVERSGVQVPPSYIPLRSQFCVGHHAAWARRRGGLNKLDATADLDAAGRRCGLFNGLRPLRKITLSASHRHPFVERPDDAQADCHHVPVVIATAYHFCFPLVRWRRVLATMDQGPGTTRGACFATKPGRVVRPSCSPSRPVHPADVATHPCGFQRHREVHGPQQRNSDDARRQNTKLHYQTAAGERGSVNRPSWSLPKKWTVDILANMDCIECWGVVI
ncbi:hypothetical protein HGRIS_003258 [Hohenbuehelia grisea]|uniref:Uncharacterized protein n=1 Tax=Hohenbuehelia grisea TaxID=104357 RepID=A0ABR3JN56_9AGAR